VRRRFVALLSSITWAAIIVAGAAYGDETAAALARRRYYQDDFAGARAAVTRALAEHPTDPAPLLVEATILGHRRDMDGLRALLERAETRWPSSVVTTLIRTDLQFLTGEGAAARTALEAAAKENADDLTVQLNMAVLYVATGEASRARALVDRLSARHDVVEADDMLTLAAVLVLLPNGPTEALALVRRCRERHGESSQLAILEGMIYLREGAWGRAVASLLDGLNRNVEKLNEVLMLAPMLSGLGHTKAVLDLIDRVRKEFPHSGELQTLRHDLERRAVDEARLVDRKVGRLRLSVPPSMPAEQLSSVAEQIEQALSLAEAYFAATVGDVHVKLLATTGVEAPAYYDALNDVVFVDRRMVDDFPRGAFRFERLLRHEFGHLVTARLLVADGLRMEGVGMPLWFVEGLAECASGNLNVSLANLPERPLSEEELLLGISLSSVGRPSCRQAYAQACLTVSLLVDGLPAPRRWPAISRFASRYRATGDVDGALKGAFGVSVAALRRKVAARMAR